MSVTPSSELAVSTPRSSPLRPPVGLLLSIGDTTVSRGGKEIPTKIDHFRPKTGQLDQYTTEALRFGEVYGAEPKTLADLYFLSNLVPDVLEIRLMCWSKTGLRGVGMTNYAALDEDEFASRVFAYEDDFLFFPKDVKEVRPELRETWEGEPVEGRIEGATDPRVEKLGIKVAATLSFCLPEVMGVGKVCQITTSGRRSIRNLYQGVWDQYTAFGQLSNIPFRLQVRPARGQRFDREQRKYVSFDFYELVLDTPLTVAEIFERLRERRDALGTGEQRLALPAPLPASMIDLPLPEDEDTRTRDEPGTVDHPSDAQLNRIALLQADVDGAWTAPGMTAGWQTYLVAAFNVESPEQLTGEQAEAFIGGLERFVGQHAPVEEIADAEVVEDERGSVSFEDLLPESVKGKK